MAIAPICAVLLARNASGTLAACLDSLQGHIENIVVVLAGESQDNTEEIARRYTQDVYEFAWIDDFSAARNFSFAKAKETGSRWLLWIDSDDVIKGADKLASTIEMAEKYKIDGIWLPYHYSFDPDGNPTTILERERILRAAIDWKWHDRVHETCGPPHEVRWVRTDEVIIAHQHRSGVEGAERNFKLLRLQLQENPQDLRTILYLGYQHFACSQWAEAAEHLDRYVQESINDAEKWQALILIGKAFIKLDRYGDATGSYLAALEMYPGWAESYYGLAEVYCRMGDYAKCIYWTEEGKRRTPPTVRMTFYNPLDYTVHPEMWFSIALWQENRLYEALEAVDRGLAVSPSNPLLKEKKELWSTLVHEFERAEALLAFSDGMTEAEASHLHKVVPHILRSFPEVRTVVNVPLWRKHHASRGRRKITFYCGQTIEPWAPPLLDEGGIGGSETAVVEIARRFARDGWQVDVYNDPGKWEGLWDKVGYWRYQWFDPKEHRQALVAWRNPMLADADMSCNRFLLWMHDLHQQDRLTLKRAARFDHILTVSDFAGDYLRLVYDFMGPTATVYNGINLSRFVGNHVDRNPHKVIYSSSWDRGLDILFQFWPYLTQVVPDAELHVFYGTKGLEYAGGSYLKYKEQIEEANIPGVRIRGRLGQKELAREMMSAGLWLYPTEFLETFCVTAVEAMAAGLGCVTSRSGALPEVLGDVGVLIPSHPRNDTYRRLFLGTAFAFLLNTEGIKERQAAGKERAKLFTWDKAFESWGGLVV